MRGSSAIIFPNLMPLKWKIGLVVISSGSEKSYACMIFSDFSSLAFLEMTAMECSSSNKIRP
jgi:hypothetical protein